MVLAQKLQVVRMSASAERLVKVPVRGSPSMRTARATPFLSMARYSFSRLAMVLSLASIGCGPCLLGRPYSRSLDLAMMIARNAVILIEQIEVERAGELWDGSEGAEVRFRPMLIGHTLLWPLFRSRPPGGRWPGSVATLRHRSSCHLLRVQGAGG